MPRITIGSGENLGLMVTFSNIVWERAGWAWVAVLMKTLGIIPSAKQAVRLSGVTQREVLTNLVPRCFTGLCILTAMNGFDGDSDEDITHSVPSRRWLEREDHSVTVHAA